MIHFKKQLLLIIPFILLPYIGSAQVEEVKTQSPTYWYIAPYIGGLSEIKTRNDGYDGLICAGIEAGIFNKRHQYTILARSASGTLGDIFGVSPPNQMEELNDVALTYQYKILSFDNVLNLSLGGGLVVGNCLYRGEITDTKSTGGFFSSTTYEYEYRNRILAGLNTRVSIDLLITRFVGFTIASQLNVHQYPEAGVLVGLKIGNLRREVKSDKGKSIIGL